MGLRDLGKHAAPARCNVSRDRPSQRLFPAFYSAELFRQRSRTRRRLRQRMRRSHPHATGTRGRWKIKTRQSAERAPRRSADFRDYHWRQLREMGSVVPRPPDPSKSVGQRCAMGNAAAFVFAHDRISVAGGPHRSRNRRAGPRGGDFDSRNL